MTVKIQIFSFLEEYNSRAGGHKLLTTSCETSFSTPFRKSFRKDLDSASGFENRFGIILNFGTLVGPIDFVLSTRNSETRDPHLTGQP